MNRALALLFPVAVCGCAIAPGIVMDESAVEERARALGDDAQYKVEPITSDLLQRLSQQRRTEALPVDPDASTPVGPYTVAPYDVLQVTVWDHPELTAPAGGFRSPEENGIPVGADGSIFYPHVGVLQVVGQTVAEIRSTITQRLAVVVAKPQLDVRVAAFRGKRVQVTGEVVQPGPMPITDVPAHVQDAISFARGVSPDGDLGDITLTRRGKTFHLDLLTLYEAGDLSQNWLLRDGDVLNVGNRNRNRVYVMGEVRTQQAKLMVRRKMTLAEALTDQGAPGTPGGIDLSTGNPSRIYVIRGNYDAPSIYHLDARSADALLLATAFELKPRDVVFVAAYQISRWNRVMSQILPTIQVLYDAALAADVARRF